MKPGNPHAATLIVFLLVCLPAAFAFPDDSSSLRVTFFDVGYGDAVLIQTPDAVLLIDAGDADHVHKIQHVLNEDKIRHLDQVILTHPHANHFGGLARLLPKITIGRVVTNGDGEGVDAQQFSGLLEELRSRDIPVHTAVRGDVILNSNDTRLTVLHPETPDQSTNDNALVLYFSFRDVNVLLLSDVRDEIVEALMTTDPHILEADVVTVPHHGEGGTRTLGPWADSVWIVSTGPSPWRTISPDEFDGSGAAVYRTDRDGTITINSDGTIVAVETEK